MNDRISLSDLPPEYDRDPLAHRTPSYDPDVTHWPTLLATGGGVLVLVMLYGWFTST